MSAHYATVTLNDATRPALTAEVDQAIAAEQALSEHVHAQLVKTLAQLEDRENALFSLIGHPGWDQVKLNAQMQQVKRDSAAARKQLADTGQALDTGRQVFLTALELLTDTRATYDREPDQVKTLLTKTIFGKLYIDADPGGTVSDADLADPFAAILNTTDNPHPDSHARRPRQARHRQHGPAQRPLRPLADPHSAEGDSLPWETIALSDRQPNRPMVRIVDGEMTDIVVFVHGWNNTAVDAASAAGLFNGLEIGLVGQRKHYPWLAGYRGYYITVRWPSQSNPAGRRLPPGSGPQCSG